MSGRITRNMSTEENVKFWLHVERSAAIVSTWPCWKASRQPSCDGCQNGTRCTTRKTEEDFAWLPFAEEGVGDDV